MYDVVVIGAGSAGCAVAARASEDPNRTVLLLEAGPDYPSLAELPFDLVNSHNNSYVDHDWGFTYRPVDGGRVTAFPRGRVTGGSSAVNTTIALRGVPEDYDHWADRGNPAWTWERVLPAFRRLERDLDFGTQPYHGDSGPITIRRYPDGELVPVQAAFLEAAAQMGYPACADANDPDGWGAGPHPMNKLGRLRVSTAIGYLSPARARPNFTIRAHAAVRRLIIDGGAVVAAEVATAEGIERVEGRLFVLAAGAIESPAVLLRSGVGPSEQLARAGIDLVAEVPAVGANLSDHPAVPVVCTLRDGALADADQPIVQTILRYTASGSSLRNDLQLEPITFAGRPGGAPGFAVAAVLEAAHTTGSVTLNADDPSGPPLVEPRFCTDERDARRLAEALHDAVAITGAPALADLIDDVVFPRLPLTDEGALHLARTRSGSGYHPCGTLRMGPSSDPSTVVDQFGHVHALDRLVVADASIMPTVPRANTNLTAIMIGEMIGEWLRTEPARYGL